MWPLSRLRLAGPSLCLHSVHFVDSVQLESNPSSSAQDGSDVGLCASLGIALLDCYRVGIVAMNESTESP